MTATFLTLVVRSAFCTALVRFYAWCAAKTTQKLRFGNYS
jgi:hypothetical protein